MESGISPEILVCRTEHQINDDIRSKLALFCNVKKEAVIQSIDAESIYDVPNLMAEEGLDTITLKKLNLKDDVVPDLEKWNFFVDKLKNATEELSIGLVGKYVDLQDSYKSILESFIHAGAYNDVKVNVVWINSEEQDHNETVFHQLDGLLVAPGFGERGIEGKIAAVKYARTHKVPFLGICLGLQMAVIEFSRHVLNLAEANSEEMNPHTPHPVIGLMEDQKDLKQMGGTMRLGAWDCELQPNSKLAKIYGKTSISERHRHRYEVNNKYVEDLEKNGMHCTGKNPQTGLVETIELEDHPWFVGVQFHPEYKSTVATPHPLFLGFIEAAKTFHQKA
jgi:CTP synthase